MASTSPPCDTLTPFAREVLQLYTEALPEVRFPDLDLSSLQAAAEQMEAAQAEVDRAEAALDRARALLEQQASSMHAQAERALAYARVFAAGNAELSERLAHVAQHNATQPPLAAQPLQGERRPRRKRRPKAEGDANLFGAGAVTSEVLAS